MRAWWEYKELLQKQIADALGIFQTVYIKMEKPDANLRSEIIGKIARIFVIDP